MRIKGQSIELDKLDWEILRTLQENSRQTYTEIGLRFGLAHSTVYDRVKKMERQDIIKKYTAIINLERLGIECIIAIMTIFTDPKESDKVAKRIGQFRNVLEVFTSLSEELLIIAKVFAEDSNNLHSFIARSIAPLPGVSRIRTSIVTRIFKNEGFSV